MQYTVEELYNKKEGQTYDRKSARKDPKSLSNHIGNYSVLLRNPQFLHKVEKWKRAEKNQRNVNIQEAKKVVC